MKKVLLVFSGNMPLELTMTPQHIYALRRGMREGDGVSQGVDDAGDEVTVACRHVTAFSVEQEKDEEKTDEG